MQKRDTSGKGETILTFTLGASSSIKHRKVKLDIEDLANVSPIHCSLHRDMAAGVHVRDLA